MRPPLYLTQLKHIIGQSLFGILQKGEVENDL